MQLEWRAIIKLARTTWIFRNEKTMKSATYLARLVWIGCILTAVSWLPIRLDAQQEPASQPLFEELQEAMSYRLIGPFRGGRSAACSGVIGQPDVFYFGAAGGGVWKTSNGGTTWRNISDGYFGGSIGAVAVAPSQPRTLYVGGGECTIRGNVSHGDGMWKSTDGGKSWKSIGLNDTHSIPRIRIHPQDPDRVYVAALGHLYGPNHQRGVFRTRDGGETWEQILFVSDEAGAIDLVLDPNDPETMFASLWQVKRTPYSLESGGPGSGLWKSEDGGDTWQEITENPGLPEGTLGIIGVAVSPVDSSRVWAQIEAADGGLFRSDNGGETWTKINSERKLRQRAWYYTRVYAGPDDIDEVYSLNVRFWRSTDGGKSFSSIRTPHGDHHDLWIDPQDADRMIVADDGGGQVSFDRGQSFSTMMNQPTAQFYRVTTDNHFPYRIYGAQQDNSTVRILSRSNSFSIDESDWESTAGGESGHLAVHPEDPDIVYGGSYGGYLTRINHRTGERRNVHVWPDNPMGYGAGELKYRFQWNFPIHFSPHDPNRLYAAANVLFVTEDEGHSWKQISPDLTRNDTRKLGPSGGPITKDNTSVEYYCTIFAFAESTHEPGVLWAGSDDGLLHLSRDAGQNWENVTPPDLPDWAQINSLEIDPFQPGGLYVAATRYKSDDFKPYLFKTEDYGKSWVQITDGIDRKHFTRVIRADPDRQGLLYAGTENGIYISFDDGKNWRPFQLDLPIVPITDLAIKEQDLVVATQGRSFYVLDDLTPLHQYQESLARQPVFLFQPRPIYRIPGRGSGQASLTAGANPRGGLNLRLYLKEQARGEARLVIRDPKNQVAAVYATVPDKENNERELDLETGINEIHWNLRYPNADTFDGMILWGGGTGGPTAVPGTYSAEFTLIEPEPETGDSPADPEQPTDAADSETVDDTTDDANQTKVSASIPFEILKDPRIDATVEDLQKQFDFLITVRDKLTETHNAIAQLRDLKSQIAGLAGRLKKNDEYSELVDQAKQLTEALTAIEEALYQTKLQSAQDPLNYPIRLNNRLAGLVGVVGTGDNPPTQQAYQVRDELVQQIDEQLDKFNQIVDQQLPAFNDAVHKSRVPAILIEQE